MASPHGPDDLTESMPSAHGGAWHPVLRSIILTYSRGERMSRVISFSAVLGTLALWYIASAAAAEFSLHDAARAGDIAQVRHLLASGAEVDLPELIDTPLHVAAAANRVEIALLLIAAGADIERPGVLGTPLHIAATTGSVDVAKVLIANGADVEAFGYGRTPLTYAAEHGHVDIAVALIAAGADVEEHARRCAHRWSLRLYPASLMSSGY